MINVIKSKPAFSFLLGGGPFSETSHDVKVIEDGNITKTVYDFKGGLRLTNTLRIYPEYNACDMVNEWENLGDAPTDIISELWDFCAEIPFLRSEAKKTGSAYLPSSENVVKVYAPCGSNWSSDEFYSHVDRLEGNRYLNWLRPGESRKYASSGGRSADTLNSPFFHIRHGKENFGIIAAIGWTGQWNAEIARRDESVIIKSKIQDTNFRIMPSEHFRTSSVTLLSYNGTVAEGQNAWRRFVKEQYSPIGKGGVPDQAPFCAGLWGGMSSDGCVDRIRIVEKEKLPFDHYWMDAGWYGFGTEKSPDEYEGDWAEHTGNWEINKVRHPDMMQNIVDEIAKSDKRFILWFEPERVRTDVPIAAEHPEYLLRLDETNKNALLNLGDERAWQYCFETLCGLIEKLKVSVYRQDFNFRPLPYWQKYDTEDRNGITEIKHINGLYKLWDALLAKYPYLLIDNCASGGRRIDIETLRRSVPLWRSDAQCPANPVPEMAQAHSIGHGAWMPYSGTGSGRIWFDTYRFRSAYSPAMTTNFTFSENNSFGDDPVAIEWLKGMCNEFIKVRSYLSEDMYPLTVPSDAADIWSAIQYHDPKSDSGVLLAFRRAESPYSVADFKLFGLSSDKTYIFTEADGDEFSAAGSVLMMDGLALRIDKQRSSKVYFYKAK